MPRCLNPSGSSLQKEEKMARRKKPTCQRYPQTCSVYSKNINSQVKSANERWEGQGKPGKGRGKKRRKGKGPVTGDCDGSPEWSGLISCWHWMMPMLWSGGRADKISSKLADDVACLGGSMVEHQPRLLGSRVGFPAGLFAIFPFLPKLHFQVPFLLSLPLPAYPFPLPMIFRLCWKKKKNAFPAFIPKSAKLAKLTLAIARRATRPGSIDCARSLHWPIGGDAKFKAGVTC